MVVDDYGHHPTEIAAVIAAARAGIDRRVVVVFQPHRYSRTQPAAARSSATALGAADEVVLTDIYAAGEAPIPGVTIEALADAVRAVGGRPVHVVKALDDAARGGRGAGATGRSGDHARCRLDRHGRRSHSRGDSRRERGRARDRAMSVKAPTEKNFRRAQVKPGQAEARRARWHRRGGSRARCVVAGRSCYAGYRAIDLVLQRVDAAGPAHRRARQRAGSRAGEVQRARATGLRGTSILTADLPAYRRRLLESPWVADVALRRVLPSTVEVFVSERTADRAVPAAAASCTSSIGTGIVIDEFGPQYAEFDLPIIDGLVRAPSRGGTGASTTRGPSWRRASSTRSPPRKDLARRLSQIDVHRRRTTPSSCSTGDPALAAPRRGALPGAAAGRTWISRRRCGSACRTSTTSICGSTSGLYVRPAPVHGDGRRRLKRVTSTASAASGGRHGP